MFLLICESTSETIQNNKATTHNDSILLPKNSCCCSGISLPILRRSVIAKINTKEVSLKIAMKVLTTVGITTFIACGKTIKIVVDIELIPRAKDASSCPLGIDCKPPLITSAIYALAKKDKNSIDILEVTLSISQEKMI